MPLGGEEFLPIVADFFIGEEGIAMTAEELASMGIAETVGVGSGEGFAAGAAAAGSSVAGTVLGQVGSSVAGSVASSLLGRKNAVGTTQAPAIPGATPIPLPDDQAVANARRRSLTAQLARQGRASTILTDQSQKLGN